jgi:glycosyltransferase involved in cell wall biosynthesis
VTTIRLLTFTTLYPNAMQPRHGIFVEQRLRHLLAGGGVESRVLAPVPWFPVAAQVFGRYGKYARVPRLEQRHGIEVRHPRYPLIPKIGMSVAPVLLALAVAPMVQRLIDEGYDFDVIDAHYFYPDGVAAAILAARFDKPFVVTARGTDISLIPRYRLPRRMICWAAERAAHIVTVCQALKEGLGELGVADDRITVLRNGVDLTLFRPVDRAQERKRLGLTRTTILSVGSLIPRKGHDLVIRALASLPGVELLIVGDGEAEDELRRLAAALGVDDRTRFVGAVAQENLRNYYGAADALVLASSREGWANVLLEAMACGTPVVASNVWGTPEVVAAPEAGVLMDERTPEAVVRAFHQLFADYPDRAATRRFAERFSWDETSRGQKRLFASILDSSVSSS